MALLPNEKLITTKEAGELSGYTSDYLSRLVRSGKIAGKKVGHSWLVDAESLNRFLGEQDDHKSDRARELARARAREYRVHRSVVLRAAKALTEPRSMPQQFVRMMSALPSRAALRRLRSHALALSVALLVLTFGTLGAQAEMLPRLAQNAAAVAEQTALGLEATFGDIPSHIAQRFTDVEQEMRTHFSRTAETGTAASARIAPRVLRNLSVSLSFGQPETTSSDRAAFSIRAASASKAAVPAVTAGDIRAFAADAHAIFTSPSRVTDAAANAYASVGEEAYGAIRTALAAYRSTLDESGARTLSAAAVARDTLRAAPAFVARTNLALGESVIAAARFALDAEIAASYGLAAAAPASARATVAIVGGTGDLLAGGTVRVAAEVPSRLARAILDASEAGAKVPEAVFSAEYAAATRFISATNAVSGRYALALARIGEVGYESVRGSRALVQSIPAEIRHPRQLQPSDLEHAGAALASAVSDAYRGSVALVLRSLGEAGRTPKVAAVLNSPPMRALRSAGEAGLAAALPALSAGEKAALAVYTAIHGLFTFATDSLANLFMPPPTIVYPSAAPERPRVVAAPAPRASNSYTTIVRGVSEDFVQQSLNSLRSSLLATIADSVRPVYMQTVTNAGTIQMVNKIEDLHDLIVRNGDFRNSVFDNGIRVSATDGRFTNLYGGSASLTSLTVSGATSLATTTVTGDLSVSGTITPSVISAGTSISAPYFVATSTTATSTFAGSLAVDTNGFVYATSTKNVGIGILSPAALLALQNSTSTQPIFVASSAAGSEVYRITNAGFVGIGTTTPGYNLAVEGSSSLGNQAIAGYFTATSTTATSTFAGRLAVGTSTPWGDGLFTVGVTTPLLYISSNTGRIGVGTSSPSVAFDVFATSAIRLPVGTSAQRPSTGDVGYVRFNTTTHQFEGYGDNSVWQGLGGVIDADQDTKITAEDSAGADNDQLKFFTFGSERMRIDSNGFVGIGTTSPAAGFAVQGTSYVSGTSFFGGALTATSSLIFSNFTGILSSNGTSGVSARTLTGTANQITIANGDGTGGNPTFSLPSLLAFTNASTSQLSVTNQAWFGGTATSTFDSTGALSLANALTYGGVTLANAVTGTGNMVLSASPTLTGTIAAANQTLSGTLGVTGLSSLAFASSTLFSNTGTAYFGATATSTFSSTGSLTLPTVALLTAPYASTTMVTATTASTTNLIASAAVTFQNLIGMLSSNGTSGTSARTLTGTANQITIANGDGTGGNPTFSLPSLLFITNASSTALSSLDYVSVGRTATTTFVGDYGASSVRGSVTVYGNTTSGAGSSLTLERGSTNGDNSLVFNDQTGSPLLKLYTSANTGYSYLNGQQSFLSLGMSVGGEVLRIDTSNNARFTGNVIPSANQQYDLGTAAVYWNNAYINNVVANNLSSASTSIAGTNTTSFSINSNNPTSDAQDMSLIFYRGAGAPSNAVLSWNSTLKRFEFNQNAYIANASASTGSTTLRVAAVAGQTAPLTSWLDSSGNVLSAVTASGNIGVGTSTPYAQLSVVGQVVASHFTATTSTASTFPYASTTMVTATTASTTNLIASAAVTFQNLIGILSSNGTSGTSARTLTGTANQITIANGDGTGGNPTFSLPSLLAFTNASTSQLSVTNQAWFGGTATSTFDSAGRLGVLTSSPTYPLEVTGAGRFTSLVDASYFVATTTTATSTFAGGLTVGTSKFVVNNFNNNIGLGTTSPSATLAVHGNAYTSGTSFFGGAITATSSLTLTESARTSGVTPYFTITGAADTGLTASTEAPDIQFNLARTKTHANGTIALQRDTLINAATHAFTNWAGGLITDLSTLGITGAPLLSTNATSTNSHTLYLGASALNASTTNSYGLTVNANTGAGSNYAAAFLGGNVGIGTTTPTSLFSVHGNAYTSGTSFFGGAITATSTLAITGAITSTATGANTFPYASTTMVTATTASTTNLIASASVTFQNLVGMLSSNGTSGTSARTLTGTANQITIANGDGTGGNPTFSLPSLLSFTNASTSQLSVFNNAYFGATATSTFDSTGALTLITPLLVASGGTGASTLTGLLQGNGTSAITGITNSSTVGQVLRVTGASTYAWGALDLADTDAITGDLPFANLAQVSANSILGNITGSTADAASIATSSLFTWSGTGLVVRDTSPTIATPTFTGLSTLALASSTLFSNTGTAYFGGTATSTFDSAGNLSVGGTLTVAGLCVTGDTRLRRRRKARNGEEDEADEDGYIYDEVAIKDVKEGDEIQSLDEKTGKLVWSRVKQLAYMGKKQTYKLTTASGKTIRTTANHPYLARTMQKPADKRRVFKKCSASIATFIDFANIKAWYHDAHYERINLALLQSALVSAGVSTSRFYYGTDERNEKQAKFFAKVASFGFVVITKPVQYLRTLFVDLLRQPANLRWLESISPQMRTRVEDEFRQLDQSGIVIHKPKANFDVEIAIDALRLAHDSDTIVLFSGDGDFAPLVSELRSMGKQVIVVAGKKFLSSNLAQSADHQVHLETLAMAIPGLFYNQTQQKGDKKPYPAFRRGRDNGEVSIADLLGLSSIQNTTVDNLVKQGEGSWLKVEQLKEGMEIGVAAPRSGAAWERIISVEAVAEEDVYDIEVEGTHNFIGNGIVAHNTALFNQASTTLFSNTGTAYFGGTATSTFNSAGALTLITPLLVASGGTGASTLTGLLQGNGTSAITGITNSSTVGQVLRVTGASTYAWGALDLADTDAITGDLPFANLAQVSANSILGNITGSTADAASIATSSLFTWSGTGDVVRTTSPTLVTPALGTPSALVLTNATGLPVAGGGTGLSSVGDGQLLFGSGGTTALTALATSTGGFLTNSYATGRPSWVATSTLFGTGTGGQILAWNAGVPQFIATTTIPLAGDVGGTLSATVIGANKVTLGMLATLAANSVIGNITGSAATPTAVATSSLFTWSGTGLVVRDTSPTIATPTITGLSTLASASSTLFSANQAYFGATATSTFTSAGRLGVLNSSPSYPIDVTGDINISLGSNYKINGANLSPGSWVASGNDVYNSNSGNIGIGTTTPYSRLSVWGGGTGATSMFELTNSASTTLASVLNDGTFYMKGNVGIGTTGPATLLDVQKANAEGQIRLLSTTGTNGAWINFNNSGGNFYVGQDSSTGLRLNSLALPYAGTLMTESAYPLAFGTNNVTRMIINSSGNVGIGTTGPSAKLQVTGALTEPDTGRSVNGLTMFGTTKRITLGYDVAGDYGFIGAVDTGVAWKNMILAPNGGNVGIGTTGPGAKLDVQGSGGVKLPAIGNTLTTWFDYSDGKNYLRGDTLFGSDTGILQYSSGNVGIGTTSPAYKLQVGGNLNETGGLAIDSPGTSPYAGYLRFGNNTGWKYVIARARESGGGALNSGATGALVTFQDDGNVGIGTTSPSSLFNVRGSNSSYGIARIINTSTNGEVSIGYRDDSDSDATSWVVGKNLAGVTDDSFAWFYNGTKMTLTNTGNVGIGTTGPVQKLQIYGAAGAPAVSGTTQNGLLRFEQSSDNGIMDMGVRAAGAGAWIQSTDKTSLGTSYPLLLNPNGGNVGIGTTSPWRTLSVTGTFGLSAPTNANTGDYLCWNTTTKEVTESATACSLSSIRWKENIRPLDYGLDEVLRLRPVLYDLKPQYGKSKDQPGLIAEEALAVVPNLVSLDAEGLPTGFDYPKLTAVLVKAVQELDARTRQILGSGGVLSIVPGVESQCVTGDTKLRRRKKKHEARSTKYENEYDYDEIEIKDVVAGDEIQSLDEASGRVVYSRVNALVDMGTQEVFELVTKSGRRIRTTGNHPFLARLKQETV